MSLELLTTIALLCGPQHQPSMGWRALECQQEYIKCVNKSKIMTTDLALEKCILEKK